MIDSCTSATLYEKYSNSNSRDEENGFQVRKFILLVSDSQIVLVLINLSFSFML